MIPLAILTGAALGLGTRLADTQETALAWFGRLVAPWVLVSFAIGALSLSRRQGMALSTGAMLSGVVMYYVRMRIVEGGANTSYLFSITAVWLLLAPVAGVTFGLAGAS